MANIDSKTKHKQKYKNPNQILKKIEAFNRIWLLLLKSCRSIYFQILDLVILEWTSIFSPRGARVLGREFVLEQSLNLLIIV